MGHGMTFHVCKHNCPRKEYVCKHVFMRAGRGHTTRRRLQQEDGRGHRFAAKKGRRGTVRPRWGGGGVFNGRNGPCSQVRQRAVPVEREAIAGKQEDICRRWREEQEKAEDGVPAERRANRREAPRPGAEVPDLLRRHGRGLRLQTYICVFANMKHDVVFLCRISSSRTASSRGSD